MTPKFIKNWIKIYKKRGFKALVKEKGWSVVIGILLFYIIKGTIATILICLGLDSLFT